MAEWSKQFKLAGRQSLAQVDLSGLAQSSESTIEGLFKNISFYLASGVDAAAVVIGLAATEATCQALLLFFVKRGAPDRAKEDIRLGFGHWLVVALEFEPGADILRTAIAPTWNEIGLLVPIVILRTTLNYFCKKRLLKLPLKCNIRKIKNISLKGFKMPLTCNHLNRIAPVQAHSNGCEDCLKTGDRWVHLRLCLECGHVGCCDSSKNKHATKHFHASKHPIIKSFEPGEDWGWCYLEELFIDPAQNETFRAKVAELPQQHHR